MSLKKKKKKNIKIIERGISILTYIDTYIKKNKKINKIKPKLKKLKNK